MPTYRAQRALRVFFALLPQEQTDASLQTIVQRISASYCLDATREELLYDEARTRAVQRLRLRREDA